MPFESKKKPAGARAAVWLWVGWALAASGPAPAAPARAEAQVAEAARELLQQQAERDGLLEPAFELSVLTGLKPLPDCAVPLDIEPLDTRHAARMRFSVRCEAAGWQQPVVVRAEVSARVVVATAEIPANRPLQASELALERRPVPAWQDAVSDPQSIVGQSSRRALKPGQPVARRALAVPRLLRRGDTVRIVARHAGIEVSANGEALDAGGQGESIRVRNTRTGKVIRARITSASTVEPEGQAPMSMPHSAD